MVVLLGIVMAGCSAGFQWSGEWKGNHNFEVKNGENPGVIRTLGQVTLKIDGSHFELVEAGVPMTGSVRFEGDRAFMKIETRFERPIDREPKEVQAQMVEIILNKKGENEIEFEDPGALVAKKLILTRVQAATADSSGNR